MTERQAPAYEENAVMFGDSNPDFAGVEIPATKPPDEFSAEERRAELLEIITDAGHPSRVNQTELAERYGVSQPMIHKDFDVLAEHVRDRVGERHELEIESVFRRSIQGLLDEGEWRKAAQTAKDYSDWMSKRRDLKDLQEELDLIKQAVGYNE